MTDQLPLPMPENRVALRMAVDQQRMRIEALELLCATLLDVLGPEVRERVETAVAEAGWAEVDDDAPE